MSLSLSMEEMSRSVDGLGPYVPARECRFVNAPCQPCQELWAHIDPQTSFPNSQKPSPEQLRVLRSAVNRSHDPFIRHLPLEIASDIFILCCRPEPDEEPYTKFEMSAPLILGAVCRAWRQFAWSLPHLWNVVFFDLGFEDCDIINRTELFAEWMLRSGRLPLHITLGANTILPEESDEALFIPLIDLVNKYADRWRALSVCSPFPGLIARLCGGAISADCRGLLELDLELYNADEMWPQKIDLVSVTPYLQKLRVHLIDLESLKVGFHHLTHLTAECFSEDECVEVMRHAPLLTVCVFRLIFEGGEMDNSPQLVMCQNLQQLVIEEHYHEDLASFFRRIQLPSLLELVVVSNSEKHTRLQSLDLAAFFERSPCPLKTLKLGSFESGVQDMKRLLSKLPTLKRLSFTARQETNMALRDVLRALADRFHPVNHHEPSAPFLPNLESLACGDCRKTFTWDIIPKIFGPSAGLHDPQPQSGTPPPLGGLVLYLIDLDATDFMDRDTLLRCLRLSRLGVRLILHPDILQTSARHHGISMSRGSIIPHI